MLTLDDMKILRDGYFEFNDLPLQDALTQIGNPSSDDIIDTALEGMTQADRNIRVTMLRILTHQSGEKAMRGILAGLNDDKRRVRSVAIKSSGNYHEFSKITDRLKAIAIDDSEKPKIREHAISRLAGDEGRLIGDFDQPVVDALQSLLKTEAYRFQILFGLVRLDLTERIDELLKAFVKNGSKDEAVMATRALSGFRVVHIGIFEEDREAEARVKQIGEIAYGRMYYWITRDLYQELTH
jgi:hypothetical protein